MPVYFAGQSGSAWPVSPSARPVPLCGQKRKCIENEHAETLTPLARRRELIIIDRRRSTSSEVVVESVKIRDELVSLSGSYGKIERVFEAGDFDFRLSGALLDRISVFLQKEQEQDPVQEHYGMTK